MTEYSPGYVKVWHGKWQGHINYRESPDGPWKKKAKVLSSYHEPDPDHPNATVEVPLPAPTGRISKKMEDEAKKALKEWRDSLIGGSGGALGDGATVSEYVDRYLDVLGASQAVEPSTLATYRQMSKIVRWSAFGSVKLDELGPEDGEAWIAEMVADGRAPTTVRKCFNMVSAACKHAVATRRLRLNPLAGVKTPKLRQSEPNALDAANRARLVSYLDAAGPTSSNTGFALALYTGMREGEVCGLRWKDVDLDARVIHVRNVIAHEDNRCYEKEPKTRNGKRDVPFGADLERVLRARMADAKAECGEAGVRFTGDLYVIGSVGDGAGAWCHPAMLYRDWKAVAKSLGLKGVRGKVPTFHDLRHTYATVATHIPGTDLKGVQMNLGHASIKTTVDVYASDDPEARRAVADATAEAIRASAGAAPFASLAG